NIAGRSRSLFGREASILLGNVLSGTVSALSVRTNLCGFRMDHPAILLIRFRGVPDNGVRSRDCCRERHRVNRIKMTPKNTILEASGRPADLNQVRRISLVGATTIVAKTKLRIRRSPARITIAITCTERLSVKSRYEM